MPTAFELQSERPPITQGGYTTPGAMEAEGQNLQASWTKSVLPAIWENTETSSNYFNGAQHVQDLNAAARQRNENRLSVEELNTKYPGMNFNGPMYAQTAEYMAQRQHRLQDLEWMKQASTVKVPGANFIPEMASYIVQSFSDPIDVGFMIGTAGLAKGAGIVFPQIAKFSGAGIAHKLAGMAIPENLMLTELKASTLPFSARMGGAAMYGFAEQAAGALAMEPWLAEANKQLGEDYTAVNSLMNVFMGGLTGSVLHMGTHAVADPFTRMLAHDKLKAAQDYVALRMNGEDGRLAAAQNTLPVTSLAARDIMLKDNVHIEQLPDGQFRASFKNETGLLSYKDGIIGRSRGDAIRNLQYMYATKMGDTVLFNELNKVYGERAALDFKKMNPFIGGEGAKQIKNSNMITYKGTRYKLEFESPVDKMFYNIKKIMNMDGNKGKPFNELKKHKETIEGYVQWITDNIGDTTEAEIRQHAQNLYTAVQKQVKETGSSKISSFTASSELAKGPEFLSTEAWTERLKNQKDILEGNDTEAAFKLLEDLYNADRDLQAERKAKLQESAKEVQKLISTTENKLREVSARDQARTEIYNTLKENKNLTEAQIDSYLTLLDYVTGDFATYLKDNGIKFTLSKEEQLAVEKRLLQSVTVRKSIRQSLPDPIDFYKKTPEEIREDSFTVLEDNLTGDEVDAVIEAKNGKYDLQRALAQDNIDALEPRDMNILTGLDMAISKGALKEDTSLYRGLTTTEASILLGNDVRPGQIVQTSKFLGTSFDAEMASRFALSGTLGADSSQMPVVLEVRAPKGMNSLDVDAAIALNHKNSKTRDWAKQIKEAKSIDDLSPDNIDEMLMSPSDDISFALGVVEGEVLLPRNIALKVLKVDDVAGEKHVVVTPDASLNKIYGSNMLKENVDVLFNAVKSNEARLAELDKFKLGTPEHEQLAEAAFYDGIPLSQEVIDAYPNLKIAQELGQEIPDSWLFQSSNRNLFRNRIIGEWTRELPFKEFNNRYGYQYLYDAGDGKFTKYPDVAIKRTGKAVLYDMGQGASYEVHEDFSADMQQLWQYITNWNPLLKSFLEKPAEEQQVLLNKVLSEAAVLTNKAGQTFVDFLDMAKNQTKKGKPRTTLEAIMFNWNSGELVYSMKSYDKGPVQLGEPKILQGMSADNAMMLTPEAIYKSMIKDNLNKVESLQKDLVKAKVAEARAKKAATQKVETPQVKNNELDNNVKTASKKVKNLEKEVEKAKKERTKKIDNVNKKSEPYNQVVKGMVDVSDEQRYIVHLFQNADISTLVHETAHIFRRTVLDTDLLERAEQALGVKNGKWTREHEEKFAESFEKYLADGKSPIKGLQGLFEQFKEWLTRIYMQLTQSPLEQELSPELRAVFDDLFAEERVKMAQEKAFASSQAGRDLYAGALTEHKNQLEAINSNIKSIDTVLKDKEHDNSTFERLRREKLSRVNSKLDMLDTPEELTSEEIRDKMEDISNAVKDEYAEGVQLVEKQLQRNEKIQGNELAFYEDALEQDMTTVTAYTRALGIEPERVQEMLEGVGEDVLPADMRMPAELKLSEIDKEAEAIKLIEGALKEFGECARGDLE